MPFHTYQMPGSKDAAAGAEITGNIESSRMDSANLARLLNAQKGSPTELVDVFKSDKRVGALLQAQAVREGYSVEEHTLGLEHQFERYLAQAALARGPSFYRLTFLLHDIGKGVANTGKRQHVNTLKIIDNIAPDLPCSAAEIQLMKAVIGSDPLGAFVRGVIVNAPQIGDKIPLARKMLTNDLTRSDILHFGSGIGLCTPDKFTAALDTARKAFITGAGISGIPPDEFFDILCPYYQIDVLGYTSDTPREQSRSRHLFLPDPNPSIENYAARLDALEAEIAAPQPQFTQRHSNLITEYYRILNSVGQFDRAFPSLDFLCEKSDPQDPAGTQRPDKLFLLSEGNKRIKFVPKIEEAVSILRDSLR